MFQFKNKISEKVKTLELELKKFKKGPAKKNQGTNTDKIKIVEHGEKNIFFTEF